jgi:hypothetical protein
MFKRIFTLLSLAILKASGAFAVDPSASFYIDHARYISPGIYEFDIMAQASGATTSFDLRTFQAGIYVNSAWVNGGTLSLSTAPGYSELSSPGYNGSYQWNATDKVINCSVNYNVKPSPSTCISTQVTSTQAVRIARIRAANTTSFGCATPDLKFNYVQNNSPLRLRTSFSWRETACTTNYELFYPARTYGGVAKFNTETYSTSDADGRSPVSALANVGNCFPILQVHAYLQGYFLGASTMQSTMVNQSVRSVSYEQTDSITVELHREANPAIVDASVRGVLLTDGSASVTLPAITSGNSYYVAVLHRNSVLVWSANPITINSSLNSIDFTSSSAATMGDNSIEVEPSVFALYSGDINQDEFVDPNDYPIYDAENSAGLCCDYLASDLNGDGFVDPNDYPYFDLNNAAGVFAIHP